MKTAIKLLLALVLAAALSVPALAEYIGSEPDEGIFITQTEKHTCTLIACTMMLRNHSNLTDSIYEHVSETAVRAYGWTNKGLKWNFTIGQVSVECLREISGTRDKKGYLIDLLKQHPEGFVIYDANAPHAIWLFGYDEETDTFYCADTTTDAAGKAIPLAESILKGSTQEEKIARLDRVWVVSSAPEAEKA